MKNHWKIFIFSFTILGASLVSYKLKENEVGPRTLRLPIAVKSAQRGKPFTTEEVRLARLPKEKRPPQQLVRMKGFRNGPRPASLNVSVNIASFKGLNGMKLAIGIKAIKDNEYAPALGELIQSRMGISFFKPNETAQDTPLAHVVFDHNNNRLYPLSTLLKIKGATSEIRSQLQQDGYQEYYYSAPTRYLYVKSSYDKLFHDYKELEARGHVVSLEVQRGLPRSR
jgi:hypothetical protein